MSRTIAPRKKNKADEDLFDVELDKLSFVDDGEITAPKKIMLTNSSKNKSGLHITSEHKRFLRIAGRWHWQ